MHTRMNYVLLKGESCANLYVYYTPRIVRPYAAALSPIVFKSPKKKIKKKKQREK